MPSDHGGSPLLDTLKIQKQRLTLNVRSSLITNHQSCYWTKHLCHNATIITHMDGGVSYWACHSPLPSPTPPPPLRNLMHLFYNHKTTWFSRAIHFDASKWNPCWRILSDYLLLLFLNNSWRFLTALFTSKLVSNKMAFTLSLSLSFLTLLVEKDFPKDWQTNKEPETHHQSKQRILGLLHCFNSAVSSDLKT